MNNLKLCLIAIAVIVFSAPVFSQNVAIDSLNNLLAKTKCDTTRLSLMQKLGDEYLKIMPDSAYSVYSKSFNLSNQALVSGKKISKKEKKFYIQNNANMNIKKGNYFLAKIELDSAMTYYQTAIEI